MTLSRRIAPTEFGLPPQTVVEQFDEQTIAIVINRKSRIIMADGKKILEKAALIRSTAPAVRIALKTSAPICSKTKKMLTESGIRLLLG